MAPENKSSLMKNESNLRIFESCFLNLDLDRGTHLA